MKQRLNIKCIYSLLLLVIVATMAGTVQVWATSSTEAEESLELLTAEEQKVIEDLYVLEQEIEGSRYKIERLQEEIATIESSVETNEISIMEKQVLFDRNKALLGEVLVAYQQQGPASFVEIILNSESIGDLVYRINVLRDLAVGTGELLTNLEDGQKALEAQTTQLNEDKVKLQTETTNLEEELLSLESAKQAQQDYLIELAEDRAYYEALITDINNAWDVMKEEFYQASQGFEKLAEGGELSSDMLSIGLSLMGIKVTITEESFNKVIQNSDEIPNMSFDFNEGGIQLDMPSYHLTLYGNFVPDDKNRLIFKVDEGSFYDVPLEPSSIDDLFTLSELVLNVQPLLFGDYYIKEVRTADGYMVLYLR